MLSLEYFLPTCVSDVLCCLFVASEWDSSLFEDASKLLSVFANVESAEMPEDMSQLGDEIIKHGGELKHIVENFIEVSPHKALEWLRGNDKVSQALDVFFEKHGHRGFAEVSIYDFFCLIFTMSWNVSA